MTGERFGRLRVIRQAPNRVTARGNSRRAWFCKCACGKTIVATTLDLRKGDVKSCGCLKAELDVLRPTKHGAHGTHLHNVWCAMRRRCRNSNQADYIHYGGRGIRVCKSWEESFEAFRQWALSNGYSQDMTIDRINVNGDYSPENCRWISSKEQAQNRRNNRMITFRGETHTISVWAEIRNIPYSTLYMRFRNGWSPEKALTT